MKHVKETLARGDNLHVSRGGVGPKGIAGGPQYGTGRSLVWPLAFLTDALTVFRDMMRRAHSIALGGDLRAALARHTTLVSLLDACYYIIREEVSDLRAVHYFDAHVYAYRRDLHLAMASMNIRLGWYREADINMEDFFRSECDEDSARSWATHLESIVSITLASSYENPEDDDNVLSVASLQARLRDEIDVLQNVDVIESDLAHDIAVANGGCGALNQWCE